MIRSGSRRAVMLSPDAGENPAFLSRSGHGGGRKRAPRTGGFCVCRRAVRLLKLLGGSVSQALSYVSRRRSSSAKVSPKIAAVSRPSPPPRESHHAEAIEDCIRFINSSSRRSS